MRKSFKVLLFILLLVTLSFNVSNVYAASYKYTITYNLDKGTNCKGNPAGFNKNNKKITLCEPTRKGYTFGGWYTDKAKTKKVTEIKKKANKNITLYAKWSKNKYYVKYDANGGKGEMSKSTFKYDTNYKLAVNTYTRKGYTFTGWNTKADGTGKSYTDAQKIKSLTNKNKKTITLYAQWRKNKYTVKYDANGGTGSMSSNTFKYNNEYTLRINKFTRNNYTFTGWNTKADGSGTSYVDGQKVKSLTNKDGKTITLYAQWKKNPTVTKGMKNALKSANEYLSFMSFSKEGLKGQLEYEKYTSKEVEYALNNINVDWKDQAVRKAVEYLDFMSFSEEGLRDQLEFEKFTDEEVDYAIKKIKIDIYKQALKKAEEYIDLMPFSKEGLRDQLKFEKFNDEEIEYALNNLKVNWYEQAVKKAEDYLDLMAFSREGLRSQLKYEKFTDEEVEYALNIVY